MSLQKRRSRCSRDLCKTPDSWGFGGESFGEMNCGLMIGSSRGFGYHLGFESDFIHTYLYIILTTERGALFGGISRAWGKLIYSGQLLS